MVEHIKMQFEQKQKKKKAFFIKKFGGMPRKENELILQRARDYHTGSIFVVIFIFLPGTDYSK